MNIVDAYRRTGSYRAAAAICGVNHKTVRRVVDRARRGRFERQTAPRRPRNTDVVLSLVEERVRQTDGRISAKRLLPEARAAGYDGSAPQPPSCGGKREGFLAPPAPRVPPVDPEGPASTW